YCKKTKSFFEDHDIDYTEHNVAEDRDKAREMIDLSGQRGVPVTVVSEGDDEQVIVGFNQDKLEDALGIEA
ncbi:MAG: glutaredoxin family protein, partial [Candidatus Nanohaloarchaea archaeon]|nr:glutaredoxin family protein [Candidatus Nanohaloarchaea archaeon]